MHSALERSKEAERKAGESEQAPRDATRGDVTCARQSSRPLHMAAHAENVFQDMQIRRERDDECLLGRGAGLVTSGVQVSLLGSSRVGVVQRASWSRADEKLTVSWSLGLRLEASRREPRPSARQRRSVLQHCEAASARPMAMA
jgi:hypothetical protein